MSRMSREVCNARDYRSNILKELIKHIREKDTIYILIIFFLITMIISFFCYKWRYAAAGLMPPTYIDKCLLWEQSR